MYQIAAFYRFVSFQDLNADRDALLRAGEAVGLCGTILLAPEGINATIASANAQGLRDFMAMICATYGLDPAEVKWSTAATQPFKRYKVRPKREIITMKRPEADPTVQCGTYVRPENWNEVITQPNMLVLDTRNTYEVEIGTFDGAVDPKIKTFSEFADFVDQHLDPAKTPDVAMFCTGGIRCEKASSYMLARGFRTVYHLQGGILKYLETVKSEHSKWHGACFVFDERVAVTEGVTPAPYLWDGSTLTAKPIAEN